MHVRLAPSDSSSSPVRPCAPVSTFPAQCESRSSVEGNLFPQAQVRFVVPVHVATILSCPAVVFRIHDVKSSGAPSRRKAISRLQRGTQSYALVASRKHTWVSVFLAWLR